MVGPLKQCGVSGRNKIRSEPATNPTLPLVATDDEPAEVVDWRYA